MPTKLSLKSGAFNDAPYFPLWVDAKALAANTAETYTVPADTTAILISGTVGFYLNATGTAAVPADTSDGTASLWIPAEVLQIFRIPAGTSLSIMPTSNGVVTIGVFKQ